MQLKDRNMHKYISRYKKSSLVKESFGDYRKRQKELFPKIKSISSEEYGTFKESLRAPIHRWFKYPAGFSYRLIEEKIKEYGLKKGSWILDPFVGSGTTSIVAKFKGIHSIGIEAHPFVYEVAKTKLYWEYDINILDKVIRKACTVAKNSILNGGLAKVNMSSIPELVKKCYSTENLARLLIIKQTIADIDCPTGYRAFLNLALTDTLRNSSKAATGWPYIGPTKFHEKKVERDALEEFCKQTQNMLEDLMWVRSHSQSDGAITKLIFGDARSCHPEIKDKSIDLALTSPPYLNNYDYADRTRLETYFFGIAKTWRDITEAIRDRLMMSATTQIRRSDFDDMVLVSKEVNEASPHVYKELIRKIESLKYIRPKKGGKKSYDIMVAGYFNDMVKVLKEVSRVLKKDHDFILVLGDSAPYGVYIPTDEYLGKLALGLGYSRFRITPLRVRGEKWAHNPQRHKVPLKEAILTITY